MHTRGCAALELCLAKLKHVVWGIWRVSVCDVETRHVHDEKCVQTTGSQYPKQVAEETLSCPVERVLTRLHVHGTLLQKCHSTELH